VEVRQRVELERKRQLCFRLPVLDLIGGPGALEAQPLPEAELDCLGAVGELPGNRVVAFVGGDPLPPLEAELEIDGVLGVESTQTLHPVEGNSGQAEQQIEVQEAKRRVGWKQQDDRPQVPGEVREPGSVFRGFGPLARCRG
jgi:hypothetical protein